MSSQNILKVNTKLKAYKLIHDPVILLNLIYSKYGDIEEDFDLLYINQLIYDKSSRYNILFKEFQYLYNGDEYLKRYYKRNESKPRIPKLSDYYKNYHLFFCRPNFKDIVISDLMENYGDDKAEIFYKNNFEKSDSNNEEKEHSDRHNSESLSSLDNITDNKIIFTKKAKKIIDQNLDPNMGTLTLTSNSINLNNINNNEMNNNDGLISKRSANDSFEKMVHNLVYYKKNKIKMEKNKKLEVNKPSKKNLHSIKKINNKVGGTYVSKKINKNIINSLNINNGNNEKIPPNIKNKNSLFSLLKSNNIINYTKTDNNINNMNGKQNNNTLTINSNKMHNKNKNNFTNIFCSPKSNYHLISKLEEFHTNVIRPNTSFHHKRNKTVYFNQNQITGLSNNPLNTLNPNNNNNNYVNTLSNILSKKTIYNNSRNYNDNLKNLNYKQTSQFNNFLTINNNSNNTLKNQRVFHDAKKRLKNKTFEAENKNKLINKISTLKENFKIHHKNKNSQNIHMSNDINNQNLIKKSNMGTTGSKFNLMKNPINTNNNKISITKNTKNNLKYYNPKFSPLNCFNKNLMNNNKNIGLHKKSQTTILSNVLESPSKIQVSSPISLIKKQNKFYNINKSESIACKIRPKITKNKINNLNINFNNVIFNAPLSNINENINFNNNFVSNTNTNTSYKLLTPTNNRINFNSTFSNNNNIVNNSHQINNNINVREAQNDKINYITNLKNFCNFSRNKTSLYGSSFSQNDDNYSLIKQSNNVINGKIIYDKNKIINHTYSNLYSNEKQDILKKKKNEIVIPKPSTKKISLKNAKKKSSQIKKSKKKIESRNKKYENGIKNFGITEISKGMEIVRKINDSFRTKEDTKNLNVSNNLYSSPNTTGRIFTIQPINVNRNINLISKKIVKTKQKIKMK